MRNWFFKVCFFKSNLLPLRLGCSIAALISFSINIHVRKRMFAIQCNNLLCLLMPYLVNQVAGYDTLDQDRRWDMGKWWDMSKRPWVRDAVRIVVGGVSHGGTKTKVEAEAEVEVYVFWIDVVASVARMMVLNLLLPWWGCTSLFQLTHSD